MRVENGWTANELSKLTHNAVDSTRSEHPSERKARLEEQGENEKLRRWKEMTFIRSFLVFAFLICAVWAIVVLSRRFSPAEQQEVTDVIKAVLFVMAGFVAGKGVDKWIGS